MTEPVVVVPLDGSPQALSALPVARQLADLQKATLRILHVTDEGGSLGETAKALGLEPAHLHGASLEVRGGRPADGIVAAAADREATLIVMCAHAPDAGSADSIGAGPIAVICDAHCPVVVVNPARVREGWALKRVLAPHDGSPSVSGALGPAIELARKAGAEFLVLQVPDPAPSLEDGSIASPVYMDQLQHTWPVWTEEFMQRLASIWPLDDLKVRLLVGRGEPAAETVRVADEEAADLIVLAWKGHWEAPHAAILKVLLRDAPCPIMVTRATPP